VPASASAPSSPRPHRRRCGVAQLTDTSAVLVVDVEGKPISNDQLTALLRAATS